MLKARSLIETNTRQVADYDHMRSVIEADYKMRTEWMLSFINGEFLGYILTYRPAERYDKKVIEVRDESLKTQVLRRAEIGAVIILSVFIELFTEWPTPPHKLYCYTGRQKS